MRQIFILLVLIFVVSLIFTNRHYIYWGHQHLGAKVGINFNNIATNSYVNWIKSQPDELDKNKEAIFLNQKIQFRDTVVIAQNSILGTSTSGKWIDVNLSEQKLYMKEGDRVVGSFLISSGLWAPTPTGSWPIWIKLRYTRMRGGSKVLGTFYDLPNVPYTMYFYQGYGIHGAYWHNNFGHPMSHGCINMKPEEAGIVFNWADVGTQVVVHY